MKKIINVVGARPNFMKIAPLMLEMKKYKTKIKQLLVHTGQHYDFNMNKLFFKQLQIPEPDIFLGVGSGLHGEQTAKIMIAFEKALIEQKPDLVVVVGHVNSTLAATLAAKKLNIKVAHIEAGLRSYDPQMPEEINRKVTDMLSDYLFTTCEDANNNLIKEGIKKEKIFFVGNVMIDTLIRFLPHVKSKGSLFKHVIDKDYLVITLHRPSNVDLKKKLEKIIKILTAVSKQIPIIFPLHPRTKKKLHKFGLMNRLKKFKPTQKSLKNNIYFTNSLGYLEFLELYSNAKVVITDSGGVQEETTYLGIPCLTLRENTERPITITEGTNKLINESCLLYQTISIVNGRTTKGKIPKLWDGKAGKRIVDILVKELQRNC